VSDYFGALMRASGVAVGERQPAATRAVLPETGLEMEVGAPDASIPAVEHEPSLQGAARPFVRPAAVAPGPTHADDFEAGHWARAEGRLGTHRPEPVPAAPAIEAASSVGGPSPSRPVGGEALIHAAIKWVVAGDPPPHEVRRDVATRAPDARLAGNDDPLVMRPAAPREPGVREVRVETDVLNSAANVWTAVPGEDPVVSSERRALESGATLALPARPRRADVTTPAPPARDEAVVVSIGSIHVRVDAPAAQTVARPMASPTSAAARPVARSADRSGLSRRPLRRI